MSRALLCALVLTAGCIGKIEGGTATARGRADVAKPFAGACGEVTTTIVYERLKPLCGGCHGTSSEYRFFADESTFVSTIASNPNLVTPGLADHSVLLKMLAGEPGAKQMPPTQKPYAARIADEPSYLSMEQLSCWVDHLPPVTGVPTQTNAAVNRRMTAEAIARNLSWALGLAPSDFSSGGSDYGLEWPDAVDPNSYVSRQRASAFGAPSWITNVGRNSEVGAAFIQISVPLSQSWCMKAAQKGGSAFYKYASPTDSSTTAPLKVRQNLASMYERVIGEPPVTETLDGLFALYAQYEKVNVRTGWAAACSGIVRHPLAFTY